MMKVFLSKITQISQIELDFLVSPLRLRASALIYGREQND